MALNVPCPTLAALYRCRLTGERSNCRGGGATICGPRCNVVGNRAQRRVKGSEVSLTRDWPAPSAPFTAESSTELGSHDGVLAPGTALSNHELRTQRGVGKFGDGQTSSSSRAVCSPRSAGEVWYSAVGATVAVRSLSRSHGNTCSHGSDRAKGEHGIIDASPSSHSKKWNGDEKPRPELPLEQVRVPERSDVAARACRSKYAQSGRG